MFIHTFSKTQRNWLQTLESLFIYLESISDDVKKYGLCNNHNTRYA